MDKEDEKKVMAAIEAQGTRIYTDIQSQRHEIMQALGELRGALMARFERVEDRLTSMAEDITVTMMAVQVEDKRRVSDRSEPLAMSELLTAMQRQTMRLRTDVDQLNAGPPPAE